MTRLVSLIALIIAAVATSAAPVPVLPPEPLPKGATARLGSLTFWGDQLYSLTFSADGKQLLAPADGQMFAWDADTGKVLPPQPLPGVDPNRSGNYAIAGNRLFAFEHQEAGRGRWVTTLVVRELVDGSGVTRIPLGDGANFEGYLFPPRIPTLAITPDGKHLSMVAQADKAVEVYEVNTGKRLNAVKIAQPYGAGAYPSPDGKTLYVHSGDKPIRRCELVTGKDLPDLAGTDGMTNMIAASPDGKWVVTRGSHVEKDAKGQVVSVVDNDWLTVHDAVKNTVTGKLDTGGHPGYFRFAGPDSLIVSAAKYNPPLPPVGTLTRWNVATLKREWEVSGPAPGGRLVLSPDGKRLAVHNPIGRIHLYDAKTGERAMPEPTGHPGSVGWVGFAASGKQVVTAGQDGFRTWTLAGERKSVVPSPELHNGRFQSSAPDELVWVTFGPDGKSAELVGWDREKAAIGWRMPVDGQGPERIFTHDGKRCIAFSWNQAKPAWEVAVYDGPGGKKLHTWTLTKVVKAGMFYPQPMALSPDGNTLFVAENGIEGLDVTTGKQRLRIDAGEFEAEHGQGPFPMATSSDGNRIAVVTKNERGGGSTLRVFEIKTGKELAAHALGKVYLPGLRFSPDGKQVAVWNIWPTPVLVCDADSDKVEPRKLDAGKGARSSAVAFSPDRSKLVVGYQDGTALIWDLTAK